jgi:aerobic C4-dicarboxylate transport protein
VKPSGLGGLLGSLYFQVLLAILAGVLLGHFDPFHGAAMKPLGDAFIKLVKMLISPIIFCTVVTGIAGMARLREVGKAGGLALIYFEVMSTLALIIGLVVVNLARPGAGVNADVSHLDTRDVAEFIGAARKAPGAWDFLLKLIPDTFVGAFTSGDVLQTLVVALLFGFALHAAGGRENPVYTLVERASQVLFRIVAIVMRAAPVGAFGAMAFTVGKYGVQTLLSLAKLMGCFYLTCLLFILVVLGGVARLHGFSILRFIRYIREELFIVLGTSSSESALPRMISRMTGLGVHPSVVGLVIPTGYAFNLDGTAIYLTLAAVYIAQATNTPLDLAHQVGLLMVLLVTSKGAATVTGAGFITLAASLQAVGHVPVEGLALIFGIDRFMSEARSLTNLIGNGVATLVVGKWCGAVDEQALAGGLGSPPPPGAAADAAAAAAAAQPPEESRRRA